MSNVENKTMPASASRLESPGRFDMERPKSTAPESSSPTGVQPGYVVDSVSHLIEAARRELDRDREAANASLAKASSILQSEIALRFGANGSRTGGLAGWQIARIRAFIDENLHRSIHARDLSTIARLSTAHFSRSFKRAFGEPPHAYVVRRRLDKACHLMTTTSISLSEIALKMGFSDQAHLCKRFRRAFGQSPSRWRRDRKSW
jgi:AraC family transcriptional regulator